MLLLLRAIQFEKVQKMHLTMFALIALIGGGIAIFLSIGDPNAASRIWADPTALATFLGAIVGFGAVAIAAWLGQLGIRNQIEENAKQQRQLQEHLREQERQAIVAALSAEVRSIKRHFESFSSELNDMLEEDDIVWRGAKGYLQASIELPRSYIYEASVQRLGLLDPIVLGRLVNLYSSAMNTSSELSSFFNLDVFPKNLRLMLIQFATAEIERAKLTLNSIECSEAGLPPPPPFCVTPFWPTAVQNADQFQAFATTAKMDVD